MNLESSPIPLWKSSPTSEQVLIREAVLTTQDNILVDASAGAAKTSSLEMIADCIRGTPILFIAFNKKIAEEGERRMPSWVKCSTINSIGHRAWGGFIRKRLILDTKKTYNLLGEEIKKLSPRQKEEAYEYFGETLKAISLCKHAGYLPPHSFEGVRRLVTDEDELFEAIADTVGDELSSLQQSLVRAVLTRTVQQGFDGTIDFDDQIYLPTLFGGDWPKFRLVLVDEAQDLSRLNHAMLSKLVTARIIAVGDPHQSIYGFRGADHESMDRLREQFSMRVMRLSVSMRCPKITVIKMRKHVPDFKFTEWAKEGSRITKDKWNIWDIPDHAFVLCRNNAPLFTLAIKFLKSRRAVTLLGSDVGPGMLKVMKAFGKGRVPSDVSRDDALDILTEWKMERLIKAKNPGSIEDRAECMKVFIDEGKNLAEAIAFAEHTFASKGTVTLMSGHKSKGLENDCIWIIDPWRTPSKWSLGNAKALQQEKNVEYVMETRTKDVTVFANLEDLVDGPK
jgi:superfamily I DNA/RNA helicase